MNRIYYYGRKYGVSAWTYEDSKESLSIQGYPSAGPGDNMNTIIVGKDELNAIHAAVFPEQHEAVKASEKAIPERCRTCRTWQVFADDDTSGQCRRHAPRAHKEPEVEWPLTYTDDWCGEWEAK